MRVSRTGRNPVGRATSEQNWALRPDRSAAGGDEPFEDALAAPDADFLVVDFDLVDDRADIGAAKGCVAGQAFERIVSTNFAIFSSVMRTRGLVSATARS